MECRTNHTCHAHQMELTTIAGPGLDRAKRDTRLIGPDSPYRMNQVGEGDINNGLGMPLDSS